MYSEAPTHLLVPLNNLRSGETGRIAQLLGRAEQIQRLQELGLRAGELIEMVRQGSPCIVRIGGRNYGFRATDLIRVMVNPEAAA